MPTVRASAGTVGGVMFLILYVVVAAAVPVVAAVVHGDFDPAEFIILSIFGVFWVVALPFFLLYWLAKGLTKWLR